MPVASGVSQERRYKSKMAELERGKRRKTALEN